MNIGGTIKRHWQLTLALALGLALYLYLTRVRVVGVVDASGDGMTINEKTWTLK